MGELYLRIAASKVGSSGQRVLSMIVSSFSPNSSRNRRRSGLRGWLPRAQTEPAPSEDRRQFANCMIIFGRLDKGSALPFRSVDSQGIVVRTPSRAKASLRGGCGWRGRARDGEGEGQPPCWLHNCKKRGNCCMGAFRRIRIRKSLSEGHELTPRGPAALACPSANPQRETHRHSDRPCSSPYPHRSPDARDGALARDG